jgi:hypothetical protein
MTTVALIFASSIAIHGMFSPAEADPVIISPVSGLSTTEEGRAVRFTVSLASQPLANVVINLVSTDAGEGTVSPASLTFTSGNWNTPRIVTVTGQPDSTEDGDISYSIQTSLLSLDPQYLLVNPPDVALVNFDEDGDRDGDDLIDAEDPDDDGDGVDDLTENDAPQDGDGNADGTPDSLQAKVASLRSSTDKSFMTLEAAACSGGFFNVRALTEGVVGEADEDYDYPFGLVLFRLSCESADVALWFHGEDALDYEDAPYREHAVEEETGGWSEAGTAGTANGLLRVELELADGEDPGQERLGGLAVLSDTESSSERIDELFAPEGTASTTTAPLIAGTHEISDVTEETNGDVSLTYTVSLSNLGTATQPDNSGPEVITFLPKNAVVDLNSLSATMGTLSVVSQGGKDVALVWNLSLQATGTATSSVTIVLPNDPIDGPPRLSARLQSSILMDIDGVDGNETLSLTDDPNQSKSVDPTPISQ